MREIGIKEISIAMDDEGGWMILLVEEGRPIFLPEDLSEAVDFMVAVECGYLVPRLPDISESEE